MTTDHAPIRDGVNLAAAAVIVGSMVLFGWALDIAALKSILPGWVSMKANTALCFTLLGIALWLIVRQHITSNPQRAVSFSRFSRFCSVLAGLIGLLTLGEYIFGWNLGIDQWLFVEPTGTVGTSNPGRMAPETALNFVLLSAALWIVGITRKTRYTILVSASIGLLVAIFALAAILTYFTPDLGAYGWFGLTIMAVHTALLFVILGVAIIAVSWQLGVLSWALNRRITAAFACGMVVLVFIGLSTNRSQFWMKEANLKIESEQQVLNNLSSLFLNMINVQAHIRGYVITGDKHLSADFLDAKTNSNVNLDALRKLSAGEPELQKQYAQIEKTVNAALQWFQQSTDIKRIDMSDAARNQRVAHGEALMDEFRNTFFRIENEHHQHVQQLKQQAGNVSQFSHFIIFTGTIASLLLFLSVMFRLNFSMNERRLAEQMLRNSEQKFRLQFESSRDALMTLAPPLWKFTQANQATLQLFGAPSEAEFTALGPWQVSPERQPDGRPSSEKAQEMIETALREGSHFFEWQHQRLDGQPFDADVLLVRMTVGEEVFLQAIVRDISERKLIETTQRFLAESAHGVRAEDFFQELAKFLAQTLAMDYVCIDKLEGDLLHARTVAIYCDGEFEDNVSYTLKDTPCGDVVAKKVCCFPREVRHLFPQDAVLQQMKSESYVGTTLFDLDGKPSGLIAVIGRQPLANPQHAEKLLSMVSARTAAELERRRFEGELRGMLTAANQSRLNVLSMLEDQKLTDAELQNKSIELGERVKELDCLIEISRLAADFDKPIGEILEESAHFIPLAFFHPEITCTRIVLGEQQFVSDNFRESPWKLSTDIVISGKTAGAIEVFYLDENPAQDEGPFLKEERVLIDNLVKQIEAMIKRRQAMQALRENEEIFRRFMEYSPVYVFFKDENMRALRLSNNFQAMLGKPVAELLGKNTDELFPSALAKSMVADDMRVLREGRQVTVEEELNGRFYSTIKFPILIDGTPRFLAGYTLDVTERKREDALRDAHTRLILFADTHSMDELLEETLNEVEKLTGSVIGFYHFVDPDQKSLTLQNWSTRTKKEFCKAEGQGLHYEIDKAGVWVDCVQQRQPVIHNDYAALPNKRGMPPGHAEVVRELVVPVMRGDQIMAILGVGNKPLDYDEEDVRITSLFAGLAWDIAERKKAEEAVYKLNNELEERILARTSELEEAKLVAEQANSAKSEFLATMSHEIRTPMNGVIGMIDVLQQSNLNVPQMETANIIHDSAFALLNVINDILDFSKIEAGKLQIESAPMAVADVMEKTCESLHSMALKRGVELTLFTDPAIPASVLGDAGRLRQVLINLANNAIKFSSKLQRQGKVSVRVKPVKIGSQRVTLEFRVTDNGIGIDSETQKGLFTAFTQADSTTTRTYGGTGLGLAISHQLVDIMDGKITVQSEPDKGSVFCVRLTFDLPPEQPAADELSSLLAGLPCLLADGTEGLADDLAAYLVHAGVLVERSEDFATTKQWIGSRPAGLCVVIIDTLGVKPPLDELRAAAHARSNPDVRFVFIERGGRQHCRVVAADLVELDAEVMHRRAFLEAVAIAAGRYKPPVAEVQHGNKVTPALSREEARRRGSLILVAEDNEINQQVIQQQLMLLGQAADIAKNGREALEHWQNGEYALLLADLHMPEMDGYELTAAIRAAETDAAAKGISRPRMPIIAFTANALKGEAEHCRAIGMDDYLSKPVQLVSLKTMLEKWMPDAVSPPIEIAPTALPVHDGRSITDRFVQSLETKSPPRSAEDLAQEFRVQQVELKMQNEELRQAQIALEESRDRYVNLYEFLPVGYLTLNGSGVIMEANLTCTTLLGVERKKLLQHRFDHFIAPEDRDRWHILFMSAMKQESAAISLVLQRGDDSSFSAHIDCRRMAVGQEKPVLRITITDLSVGELGEAAAPVGATTRSRLSAGNRGQEAAPTAVDVNVLKALIGGDEAMIREFLHDYRLSVAKTAAEIRAAYAAGQIAATGALAHKLKSSSRSVGALALGELCAAMEKAGKAGDTEALAVLLPKFEQELAGVEGFLEGY